MGKTLSHQDYTVGWVCPLEVEQIAAVAMLDEEHERLPQPPTDHNVYTLGSIAGHNVAIAGLHLAGNSPAATVVTQMRTTFPNLKFGMLVGIGGGVPVRTENGMIRLGHVVVSKPTGGHSGAVQYDHGKAKIGQFERTGALAPPPAVLLNAAQDLAVKRASSRKDPIQVNIKRIDTGIRGLRRYKHPGMSNDHLYKANYRHREPGLSCNECGCDPAQRIPRPTDDDDDDDEPYVEVHRGTIASGELVVKDPVLRDKLAKEYGFLCFEMEAAGALADFPCIVIRGISDYCDSHKDDRWHGYAAAAAAAYARLLFFHMPVDEVRRYISDSAETDIHHVRLRHDDQDRQDILDWIALPDYGSHQSHFLERQQPGTCRWFLDSEAYQAWLQMRQQTLFCPGIPGAGKTILTSVLINDLQKRYGDDVSVGVAYIYCNFQWQEKQKINDLLASLLRQLAEQSSSLPGDVKELYRRHKGRKTRPSFDELSNSLHSVATTYARLFIVIDALDECQRSDGCRARFLSELFDIQKRHGANILATSRVIQDIEKEFEGSVRVEIQAKDDDVQMYLDGHMDKLLSFVLSNPDLQRLIKSTIAETINGMFLLAPLHMDELAQEATPGDIEVALQNLPRGLSDTYERAMLRIEGQGGGLRDLAKKVLSLVCHANRALSTAELQHAVAVRAGQLELNEKFIPTLETIGLRNAIKL
ncbi:hypothetical protein NEMBOFW57_009907 [Staphylotrichum longicolle]|uniref:Nephrocystin 3-like N-terminal domain-containing protein n=1 Tax=Staphylotrichum longicolle TaxID=669026 RepID=A0AAD4HWD8_9PEZI|nr:hypothetical protein NEMBOFW57_009907 [Staphylotrichum longicolle]